MRNGFVKIVTGVLIICVTSAANAQAPSRSVVVASPTYTSIAMDINVDRPAADVWKRVGKYCDVAEWLQIPAGCRITSGKDGEVGAVRTVGNGEVLVAKTEFSYTYAQTPREGTPYNLYHGTIEVRFSTRSSSTTRPTMQRARRTGKHGVQGSRRRLGTSRRSPKAVRCRRLKPRRSDHRHLRLDRKRIDNGGGQATVLRH